MILRAIQEAVVVFQGTAMESQSKTMEGDGETQRIWNVLRRRTGEPGGLQSMGLLRVGTTERLHFHFSLSCIGEGNGNPLQCSWLENPRDGGAWWAAVYRVAQSRTRLK